MTRAPRQLTAVAWLCFATATAAYTQAQPEQPGKLDRATTIVGCLVRGPALPTGEEFLIRTPAIAVPAGSQIAVGGEGATSGHATTSAGRPVATTVYPDHRSDARRVAVASRPPRRGEGSIERERSTEDHSDDHTGSGDGTGEDHGGQGGVGRCRRRAAARPRPRWRSPRRATLSGLALRRRRSRRCRAKLRPSGSSAHRPR